MAFGADADGRAGGGEVVNRMRATLGWIDACFDIAGEVPRIGVFAMTGRRRPHREHEAPPLDDGAAGRCRDMN